MSFVEGASSDSSLAPSSGMRGWNDPPDLYSMQCTNSGTSDNPFRRKTAPKTSKTNKITLGASNQMSSTVPFFNPTIVQSSSPSAQMSSTSNYNPNNLSLGQNVRIPKTMSTSGVHPGTYENGHHANASTVDGAANYATENGLSYLFSTPPASQLGEELNASNMGQQLKSIPTQNAPPTFNGVAWTENGYSSNVALYNNFSYSSNYTQVPHRNIPYSN